MPTAQSIAAAHGELIRAFFVDGYNQNAGSIAFQRLAGEEPKLIVRFANGRTLETVVPLATWTRIRDAALLFDRTLTPIKTDDAICLHAWDVKVEAVDPAAAGQSKPVRAIEQSACATGLAVPLAFQMASEAIAALPACALLDPKQYRNDVTRLFGCTLLEGDRAAAAEARNVYGSPWFDHTRGDRTAYTIQDLFFDRAHVDWNGTIADGTEASANLWSARLEKGSMFPRHIVGETADRVRMDATVVHFTDGSGTQAPVTIIWTRENGFGFRVRSATVGAPKPLK